MKESGTDANFVDSWFPDLLRGFSRPTRPPLHVCTSVSLVRSLLPEIICDNLRIRNKNAGSRFTRDPALVDEQQRLNCALPCRFFELWFLSIPESQRHVQLDDQLIHPKDLAVDLCYRSQFFGAEAPIKRGEAFLLRKEVIQPQVPLRLPCYDFIPVTAHSVGGYLPCGLMRRLRLQVTSMM